MVCAHCGNLIHWAKQKMFLIINRCQLQYVTPLHILLAADCYTPKEYPGKCSHGHLQEFQWRQFVSGVAQNMNTGCICKNVHSVLPTNPWSTPGDQLGEKRRRKKPNSSNLNYLSAHYSRLFSLGEVEEGALPSWDWRQRFAGSCQSQRVGVGEACWSPAARCGGVGVGAPAEEQSAAVAAVAAARVVEEPRPPRFAAMGRWWSAGAAPVGVEPCLHCHLQQPDPRVVLPFLCRTHLLTATLQERSQLY